MMRWISIALLAAPAFAGTSLDDGYREMYNLDFMAAHSTFAEYQKLHPSDPMGPVSDAAAYLFSELDRLHVLQSEFFTHDQHFVTDHKLVPDPLARRRFDEALDAAARLAAQDPNNENSMFASVMRSGLRSNYMALIEKRYGSSLGEMKAGRVLAEKLLTRNPEYADAWLAVGVENYMLSIKAAPLRFFLRLSGAQTDRETGLEKLRITAAKGRYLAPFARLMLAVAAMRDNKRADAAELLRGLVREYPRNYLYAQELTRLQGSATP
jgi:tetratricopeptide (TPR) repeat protein